MRAARTYPLYTAFLILATLLVLIALPVRAFEAQLVAPSAEDALSKRLERSSAVFRLQADEITDPQEILAAARSDYRTMVQVLYDEGYFGPVVRIRINGREAASIPPIDPPARIDSVEIEVVPGRAFRFGTARIAPLAPGTMLPEGFASGEPATSGLISDAARAGVTGWLNAGHAKAAVGEQSIQALHDKALLNADIEMRPGPLLRFGRLNIEGQSEVRDSSMRRIAGFPTGEIFSPNDVRRVNERLRRTGAFSSVSITEADTPNPDGTLDFTANVVDQKKRRISFGAEIQSRNGLALSAAWIHRNLFGNADRLKFEAQINNLGGEEEIGGFVTLRLDQPHRLGPDDNVFYLAEFGITEDPHYSLVRTVAGIGVSRQWKDNLLVEAAFSAGPRVSNDAFGDDRRFNIVSFPGRVEFDKRDNRVSPTKGYYINTLVTPFLGYADSGSGVSSYVDSRVYFNVLQSGGLVLAGRAQLGSTFGPGLSQISPEYLFFSGGAGTVRGQPYLNLGIPIGNEIAGGRSFLGLSTEIRARVRGPIWMVGFFDWGAVGIDSLPNAESETQSGAGLGVRYELGGLGPIRLDLALPVTGVQGSRELQFYLGIGQAF